MSAVAASPGAARLPPLREEIAIFPGPSALDGSPTWTLHDPARNRFYRLGWREFEIISRWNSGTVDDLTSRVATETTLRVGREDVEELAGFLRSTDMLLGVGAQMTASLLDKIARQRQSWGRWLLHNYLFVRIPLVRPDRFLTATYPLVSWIYSRAFLWTLLLIGAVGIYLIARQWDVFLATFVDMFTLQGAVLFGITLGGVKVIHELGHAYTAKRYGCRVPSMGVALLVLVPVLYTDVNEAWKLTERHKRLAIGVAGVTAELGCAAIAACAWGFLPNGPVRSVAFLIATTTWVTSVLLNLSPFMRFDGYYVLSDWLEMPNLHARSFALARWWLRETLLGLGDAPPEQFPRRRAIMLVLFAFGTWAYRFLLFIGIAVLVYHFTFKAAGIVMAAVEIGYFLVLPVLSEARVWWRRRREVRWNARTLTTGAVIAAIVALFLIPWRTNIEAPALLKSQQRVEVFMPEFGARVAALETHSGALVQKGAPLLRLTSPDLDYRLKRARSELEILEWQVGSRGLDAALLARSQIAEREYETARSEWRGLNDQKARLDIGAPIAGRIVDVADGLTDGAWLPAKARLMSVVDPAAIAVEAYIDEADLGRVKVGDSASFFAEADAHIDLPLRVSAIASASTRLLSDLPLASTHGGPITVRGSKPTEMIPDRTLYRVTLTPGGTAAPPLRVVRGSVVLRAEPVSFAVRAWRAVLAIAIRESGA
jgi:putative peptide zinc metalloprotease protein